MLYQWLIPILAFVAVTSVGGALISAVGARRRALAARLGTHSHTEPHESPGRPSRLRQLAESLGSQAKRDQEELSRLRKRLLQAGFTDPAAPAVFVGSKLLLFLGGGGLGLALTFSTDWSLALRILTVTAGAGLPNMLPDLIVHQRRAARRSEVQQHLPDAIDLLEICVSSGMGLQAAWNHAAEEMRRVNALLADEMALTNLEIHLGSDQRSAMHHMAERTGSQDLASLVAAVVQSQRFGTSIAEALRTFAGSLREQRSHRAREAAEKMSVKLLFPMVGFIFPAMFIVGVGPAAIKIVRMFEAL